MANYMRVTVNDGNTEVATDGYSKSVIGGGKEPSERRGKQQDLAEGMKNAGTQSCYINGNSMTYSESKVTRTSAPTEGVLPGILSTAKNSYGAPINDMTQINQDSLIEHRGTQLQVKTALNMGILSRDGSGNYHEVGHQANTQSNDPKQHAEAEHKPQTIVVDFSKSDGHRDVVNALKSRVGSGVVDSYMAQVLSSVTTEKEANTLIADFAQEAGMSQDKAHEWTTSYINSLYDNGLKHISKVHKVNPASLEKYVKDKTSKAYQQSLLYALYLNNLKAGDELVRKYKLNERMGV